MKYRMIIFDFDGTLADSFPWFEGNINKAADIFKFKRVVAEDYKKLRRLNSKDIINHLHIAWWKIPLISFYMRKWMFNDVRKIQLFKDVDKLLITLKQTDIKIALVSSNSLENIKAILGPSIHNFDYLECGTSLFGKSKKFKKLLSNTGFSPLETLSIGDEIRDIEAAKKLNMHSGSVTWGYGEAEALMEMKPDYIFSSVLEIETILQF